MMIRRGGRKKFAPWMHADQIIIFGNGTRDLRHQWIYRMLTASPLPVWLGIDVRQRYMACRIVAHGAVFSR